MTPFHERDGITIYNEDARLVFSEDQISSVNGKLSYSWIPPAENPSRKIAVITDPPYGTNHYASDKKDMSPQLLSKFLELADFVSVFGWAERLVDLCVAARAVPSEWVTWWPTNGALRGFNLNGLWRDTEHIAIFGTHRFETLREDRTKFGEWLATEWTEENRREKCKRIKVRKLSKQRRMGDVWRIASPHLGFSSKGRLHPNEKPVEILSRLIAGSGCDLVIDPFMGSGTTLVAARSLGCKAIGIEINRDYCDVAIRRLSQGLLKLHDATQESSQF